MRRLLEMNLWNPSQTSRKGASSRLARISHPGFVTDSQPARHLRSTFARDVLVNVAANLIAAGIIYLGAVAAGYITLNIALAVMITTLLILSVVNLALGELGERLPSPRAARINERLGTALGFTAVVIMLGFAVMAALGLRFPD